MNAVTPLAHGSRAVLPIASRYEARAPRYTSYPTAVQFSPAVDAAVYQGWLEELSPTDPISLYLHIPFCERLCWYCGCNTRAVNRRKPVAEYILYLLSEIELLRRALPGRLPVQAIHFGGGTPNMLSTTELEAVVDALKRDFDFTEDVQIAAELDPAVLTEDWAEAAGRLGLTRASLGVQNLDPAVQQAVNRFESVDEIARCMGWLRAAGVGSINLDLMYGLPRQTTANTLATIDALAELRPERLALFGYAHVPWMKAHQRLIDEAALPDAGQRLEQSEAAADRLVELGYVRIGLDHFALPHDELAVAAREGRLHRNFQGYTADPEGTILGLGASAIGSLPQGFVQNAAQELTWRAALDRGDLPVSRGVAVTAEDRLRADVIERLMCDFAVDLEAVAAAHAKTSAHFAEERDVLVRFQRDRLVDLDGDRVTVTELGRPMVRVICAVFDQYLAPEAGRHAASL